MAKVTNAMLMEAINGINGKVDSLSKRVEALEGKSTKVPTKSGKGVSKLYSVELKDYEPTIKDGFYKWGKKTDTLKSGNYMACRKAYCYAVATNGKAITSEEVFKAKLTVDYSENGAYNKAKAQFEKKFPYTKKADR